MERVELVRRMVGLLRAKGAASFFLNGPPGSGKTYLLSQAAADLAASPPLPVPGHSFRSNGAPIDTPAARGAPAAPAAERALAPLPGIAAAPPLPEKQLTLSVGTATSTGPKARLSINVAAKPPSEAMQRLMTQLNKLV